MSLQLRCIVSIFLLLAAPAVVAQPVPRFEDADSAIIDLPKDQQIRFGYLVVPEDRTKANGRTIRLPVFILKSRSGHPKQDPVLYTAGGPGSSSVNTARYGAYYSFLNDRDFIVFEQRGTQYAQPSLGCPELDSIKRTNRWLQSGEREKESLQAQAALRCQTRLVAEGIDLSAYTTKASAEDIEDLRKVLGINQWNLYTVSYSTKIAQVLLRDHPASIKSAVLDSPLPLWANYDETSLQFLVEKMNLLFAACAADSACNTAYPNLKSRFEKFLLQANGSPVWVDIKSPVDSTPVKVAITGTQVIAFLDLGNTYNLKALPKLIDQLCNNNYTALKPFIYRLFASDDRSMGMRLSVWCAEEYPFEQPVISGRTAKTPLPYRAVRSAAVPLHLCRLWKVTPAEAKENRPFRTDVPVLLVNGALDPDTPAAWGAAMAKQFTNSFHFVFKGMSHTPTQYWDNGCAMQLAQSFFDHPLQRPAVQCFTELKPLAFDTKD